MQKQLCICALALASMSAQAMNGDREAVSVGTAKNIEVVSSPAKRQIESRVWTTEGKSYRIYGVLQGVEGTSLSVGLGERNDVRYLCGGMPKSCAVLVK